ncbi:MAG TPA: hypothetical protein VFY39_14255 [Gammaproteobacteria bacterium]|nr:hypothetical protein [Gammaproteobacteria bacterium]
MAKKKSVEEKLEDLEAAAAQAEPATRLAGLKAALRDKHYRLVAKAAKLGAEALLYELVPEFLNVYPRFLEKPAKTDPSCIAKKAIMRALVALDCDDSAFFSAALRYRQPEPVWGGSVDTAVDVRASAAMGLVATGYPRALVELAELLNDPEAEARAGAVRAIGCGNPREAELLLRAKVLFGDREPSVIGEAFAGLLAAEPDASLPFVARYLGEPDPALCEAAALALGESRLDGAVAYLRASWDQVFPPPGLRRSLLRAAAMNRSRAADDWLLALVETASEETASQALEEIATYNRSTHLRERLEAALATRGSPKLIEILFANKT